MKNHWEEPIRNTFQGPTNELRAKLKSPTKKEGNARGKVKKSFIKTEGANTGGGNYPVQGSLTFRTTHTAANQFPKATKVSKGKGRKTRTAGKGVVEKKRKHFHNKKMQGRWEYGSQR